MASKRQFLIWSTLLLLELCHGNVIPMDADYFYSDDEAASSSSSSAAFALPAKSKRSWFSSFEHNLGKFKNFYANLLQEENQEYAVEIQELYNVVSQALVEPDSRKKERMLIYSMWLLEATRDLQSFLIAKGMNNI